MVVPGTFKTELAKETPDGVNRLFNAPDAWVPGTLYVVINGHVVYRGFTFPSGTQVQFDVTPQVGDVITFLYNAPPP